MPELSTLYRPPLNPERIKINRRNPTSGAGRQEIVSASDWGTATRPEGILRIDLSESEQQIVVELNLPGISYDDVSVRVRDGRISVVAHAIERNRFIEASRQPSFYQSIPLPNTARLRSIVWEFANERMLITIPKARTSGQAAFRYMVYPGS